VVDGPAALGTFAPFHPMTLHKSAEGPFVPVEKGCRRVIRFRKHSHGGEPHCGYANASPVDIRQTTKPAANKIKAPQHGAGLNGGRHRRDGGLRGGRQWPTVTDTSFHSDIWFQKITSAKSNDDNEPIPRPFQTCRLAVWDGERSLCCSRWAAPKD
jgi:hypothetical protein